MQSVRQDVPRQTVRIRSRDHRKLESESRPGMSEQRIAEIRALNELRDNRPGLPY